MLAVKTSIQLTNPLYFWIEFLDTNILYQEAYFNALNSNCAILAQLTNTLCVRAFLKNIMYQGELSTVAQG